MTAMRSARRGVAGASKPGGLFGNQNTHPHHEVQAACRAVADGLIAGADVAGAATILQHRLDVPQRLWVAAAAVLSLPEPQADWLCNHLGDELERHRLGPVEAEAARQRRQWARHCARSTYRSPALTRAERARARRISFHDTPRERLSAAWLAASDADRGDLLRRALGRAGV